MRRADRLFQIIQLLRRDHISTAGRLAGELGVSERTLYRDIQDLLRAGVPIESESGVGYRLPRHFDLPPLMFTTDELEALLIGARTVEAWADPSLQEAARSLVRKVASVLPANLRPLMGSCHLLVPDFHVPPEVAAHLAELRRALRERRQVRIGYQRPGGPPSRRLVHPLGLAFWGQSWTLAAWCGLREDLRTFRLDRIVELQVLETRFEAETGRTLESYLARANAPVP